jgi:hypothetical protein
VRETRFQTKARPDGYTLVSTPTFQITMAPFTLEAAGVD